MRDQYLLFKAFSGHYYAYTMMGVWKNNKPTEPGMLFYVVPGQLDIFIFTWAPLNLQGEFGRITPESLRGYLQDEKSQRPCYRRKKKCRVVLSQHTYFWRLDETRLRSALSWYKAQRWLGYARKKVRNVPLA